MGKPSSGREREFSSLNIVFVTDDAGSSPIGSTRRTVSCGMHQYPGILRLIRQQLQIFRREYIVFKGAGGFSICVMFQFLDKPVQF